jgi:hypothetical protein
MKTLVIELVNASQSCTNSCTCGLPVVKLCHERLRQADLEVCRYHPLGNEGRIVVEGIGVGISRYFVFLFAIEVRL